MVDAWASFAAAPPACGVVSAGPEADANGRRKSFHAPTNAKTGTAASVGRDSGSITGPRPAARGP
ncbi:hypothetical protein C1708_30885 [Streptomyces sp. DH-12]|uniref:hypothetical protein n=1 Tax=unclassified Streptomyces TaxID=2593676 RepID=UPI000CCDE823|nr:hypothetical protein [Streptomyces sp. DH-12]PNV36177.1 hypothetical protein C1708_30885 [Streptomyces sp. DH-12]